MNKVVLLCLFMTPWIYAHAGQEEMIDHSANLTATYEFTSGNRVTFDLDQCSRFSFVGGIACGIKLGVCLLAVNNATENFGLDSREAACAWKNLLKWTLITTGTASFLK